jgi:hypothetical protein
MQNYFLNVNESVTSLSQNLNTASKIDMVFPTTQQPDVLTAPRTPGSGKEYIVHVAPDFDATYEFGS